jgi:hypothetical protein
VTDTGLKGSDLDAIRARRHRERAESRGDRLAARRAEVLTPEFLQAALTSKAGLRHVHAAIGLHARGNTGALTTRQVRDAIQALFANPKRSK